MLVAFVIWSCVGRKTTFSMELKSVCPIGMLNRDRSALAADVSNSETGSVKVYCKSSRLDVRDCVLCGNICGGGMVGRREDLDGVISAAVLQLAHVQGSYVWLGAAGV